jgi:hypothetical protein
MLNSFSSFYVYFFRWLLTELFIGSGWSMGSIFGYKYSYSLKKTRFSNILHRIWFMLNRCMCYWLCFSIFSIGRSLISELVVSWPSVYQMSRLHKVSYKIKVLQVNYVKHSSFDFVTHLEFSSLALQIWKTLANPLREFAMFLFAVAIFQCKQTSF